MSGLADNCPMAGEVCPRAEKILLTCVQEILHLANRGTQGHHERTRKYALAILKNVGSELGFTPEECELIGDYAALHDVGKVSVRPSILDKPGALTAEEYDVVKQHTIVGLNWLNRVQLKLGAGCIQRPDILRNIIGQHHERCDGSGYPWGLTGDEIAPEAHVVAVADIFDAMTSKRSYDRVHTAFETLEEIRRMTDAGKLNPIVVDGLRIMVHQINT